MTPTFSSRSDGVLDVDLEEDARGVRHALPETIPVPMSLNEWFLLAWGLVTLGMGLIAVISPETAVRSRNRTADGFTRLITLGHVKKAFGPFTSEETDLRLTFWGGVVLSTAGAVALFFALFG
jgi:hypothetical protein